MPASSGISRSQARRSTARCGSRTRTAATSTGSISPPTSSRISAPSRIRAPASASAPTACIPTPQNNLYLLDFAAGNIVKIDAKTKLPTVYLTPTPNSRPRRGRVDARGPAVVRRISPATPSACSTRKTEKISEWKVPTPWSAPYDAAAGRNGEAWTGSMLDRPRGAPRHQERPVHRISAAAPDQYPARLIDDSKSPGTLWVGNNHGASIVKVEPLD